MSGYAAPRSRPWVGMAGADTPSQPDARDAAAASSMNGGADVAHTNARAISFGFAATAVLVSLFLLLAIFEHLIKPGLASFSSATPGSHHEESVNGEGSGGRGLPRARRHPHDGSPSPNKLRHAPKVEEPVTAAADLPVLMPGQRYPTFLAQPAPLAPCPREGVWWPPHEQRHSFVPP